MKRDDGQYIEGIPNSPGISSFIVGTELANITELNRFDRVL
jgi:hypothetical protein